MEVGGGCFLSAALAPRGRGRDIKSREEIGRGRE